MLEQEDDGPDRPKRISVEYNYFGDGEFSFDEDIVRRIRFDFDKQFVPVFKREVYRYATGGTKVFKHFGFGVEHVQGFPIMDGRVYGATKPFLGYLAQIGRALGVSVWAQGPPFAPDPGDGTPGETVRFDERAENYAKECFYEMKRLAEKAGQAGDELEGVPDEIRQLATKAVRQQHKEVLEKEAKATADAESELTDIFKEDSQRLKRYFTLSDYDLAGIDAAMRDPNPTKAVHFGPARPARPGSMLYAP